MSKNLTISEQITVLEQENHSLKRLEKITLKFIKKYYELSSKQCTIVESQNGDFEAKISAYFKLNNEKSKDKFLEIMLTETALNYFNSRLDKQDS